MNRQRKRPLKLDHPCVVGVVDSPAAWRALRRIPVGALDVVELRLDCLAEIPPSVELKALEFPWIATVRDPGEGGNPGLSDGDRERLFLAGVESADAVDIELANTRGLAALVSLTKASGSRLILSVHDFKASVPLRRMRELAKRARDAGADVFKIATTPASPGAVAELVELLDDPPLPVAAMAMGPLGRPARLLLAACGSVLNYGWIARPVVSGQWRAVDLKKQLALTDGDFRAGE